MIGRFTFVLTLLFILSMNRIAYAKEIVYILGMMKGNLNKMMSSHLASYKLPSYARRFDDRYDTSTADSLIQDVINFTRQYFDK